MADSQILLQRLAALEQKLNKYHALSTKVSLSEDIQERAHKAKQASEKLKTYLKDSSTLEVQLKSNIHQDPKEVAEAEATIAAFEQEDTPEDVFLKITKIEFVEALKQRVKDPKGVSQNYLNLCGAASFMVLWIERDPRGFTKAAIELFQTGKSKYKDIEIKANRAMFKTDEHEHESDERTLQLVDWLMLSALQNASGLLGYNPNSEWGGIRGIGLPNKVLKWFEQLSGGEAKKYRKDFKPSQLNKLYREDHYVLFLVNVDLLALYFANKSKEDRDITIWKKLSIFFNGITGNHYVVLNSTITKEDDNLVFDLWTWANNIKVRIPGRAFNKAIVQTFVVEPEKEGQDEY